MVRLLTSIVHHQGVTTNETIPQPNPVPLVQHQPSQDSPALQLQGRKRALRKRKEEARIGQEVPTAIVWPSKVVFHQPPRYYWSSAPIKEGLVEKKGHATGWFFWPR